MNSVDKTLNCILPSDRLTCRYLQYVNTLFESLVCQDIENQPITSPKYAVMMPRSCQNERNRALGMLANGTSKGSLVTLALQFLTLMRVI